MVHVDGGPDVGDEWLAVAPHTICPSLSNSQRFVSVFTNERDASEAFEEWIVVVVFVQGRMDGEPNFSGHGVVGVRRGPSL